MSGQNGHPWTVREINGEEDLPAIFNLIRDTELYEPTGITISLERLRSAYREPLPGWWRELRLWEQNGRLMGLSDLRIPDERPDVPVAYLRMRIHPDVRRSDLLDRMLDYGERTAQELLGPGCLLETSAADLMLLRRTTLESRGYAIDRVFERRERVMGDEIVIPPVPSGYQIRPLAGESEVDAWIELYNASFQDHYDFHPIHRDLRSSFMLEFGYICELDLIAQNDQDELVAFCLSERKVDDAGTEAWEVQLVGTNRKHRKRGLAEVLVMNSLAHMRQSGAKLVAIEVDATNPTGATRLYDRLGFKVVSTSIDYRKKLA